MQIFAREFVRKMRGGSQAHLIEANDDKFYVVKFRNNPQHRRVLINELIASTLLEHLEIGTPEMKLIELTPGFLESSPEVFLQFHEGRRCVEPGLHLASCFPGHPKRDAVFDFLPDSLLPRCLNLQDYLGAFVFDHWVSNTDSRQSIFYKPHLNNPRGRYYLTQMIDNGEIFSGLHWRFRDSPIQARYFRLNVYQNVSSLYNFRPWLDRLEYFPSVVIDEALGRIPAEWIEGDRGALEELLESLFARRHKIVELIYGAHLSNSRLFPGWTADPVPKSGGALV